MEDQEDVNRIIEKITGIYDILCIDGRQKLPSFGKPYMRQAPNRLQALLNKEGINIKELGISTAIDFFMPSTTDFSRSWVGNLVAQYVNHDNPKIVTFGCSTGLEIYWIIHFLLKKGTLLSTTKIIGVDINSKALEIARSATYSKYYFDGSFYNKDGVEDVLLVDESLGTVCFPDHFKKSAEFLQGNLLDPNCFRVLEFENLDIIVLMNVLKYMNSSAIQQVLEIVNHSIRIGGILITDVYTFDIVSAHPNFESIGKYALKCISK